MMVPNKRICVVGAGPSGIAAAKNCILFGLDVVVFEKDGTVKANKYRPFSVPNPAERVGDS
jgi:flavin-dependent dehydrogenase